MGTDKINDGVGKKIVEALKMQSSESQQEFDTDNESMNDITNNSFSDIDESSFNFDDDLNETVQIQNNFRTIPTDFQNTENLSSPNSSVSNTQAEPSVTSSAFIDSAFAQSVAQNLQQQNTINNLSDDFAYPANVAILRQLIAKLPAGVSKQTGAVIIKQTMEALGISMQSVLQEAHQTQESLINNARECQAGAVEYRKQISILEAKAQQYQKQAAIMRDVINLFLHSSK